MCPTSLTAVSSLKPQVNAMQLSFLMFSKILAQKLGSSQALSPGSTYTGALLICSSRTSGRSLIAQQQLA